MGSWLCVGAVHAGFAATLVVDGEYDMLTLLRCLLLGFFFLSVVAEVSVEIALT